MGFLPESLLQINFLKWITKPGGKKYPAGDISEPWVRKGLFPYRTLRANLVRALQPVYPRP